MKRSGENNAGKKTEKTVFGVLRSRMSRMWTQTVIRYGFESLVWRSEASWDPNDFI